MRSDRIPDAAPAAGPEDPTRELAERNRELTSLLRVSELILGADTPGEAYGPVLREVARVMDVPVVLLEHLDHAKSLLIVVATHGVALSEDGPVEVPQRESLAAEAARSGHTIVVRDALRPDDDVHDFFRKLAPRSWASFPLSAKGQVGGVLTLVDRVPREMDGRWTRLGTAMAAHIGALLERLEATEEVRESESRYRALATELHQANQELESFSYSVSHDLRAPLRTMQGFAHTLLRDYGQVLDDQGRDYVQRIVASGKQSERLIADLLAYSRLSFQRVELKPVELRAVVDQAREQVESDLAASGARLTVSRSLPTVLGNHTALVQVVANLLSNAVKFCAPEQQPVVRIRGEERGNRVRLWVEDNGIGIPEGQEERIFRVFERLSESTDRPGTGIGLAIVRRGMQRIGGACGVQKLDEGSAFWIEAVKDRKPPPRPWMRLRRP